MKKFLMAIFALAVATSVASAGIGITWTTYSWGNYSGGGGAALLDNNDALWQLIFAGTDNLIDSIDDPLNPMDPAAWAANNYLRPGGDDQLLAERIIPMGGGIASDGTDWDEWLQRQGPPNPVFQDLGWAAEGYVYQRVFESSTPLAGSTQFFQSGLLELDTGFAGGTATPQDFFVDDPSLVGNDGFTPDRTPIAIPEPATMSLLGLGALAMVLRRRRS